MNRIALKQLFNADKALVFPVIHVLDTEQALRNVNIAVEADCPGVFLINHDFAYPEFLPVIQDVRKQHPNYWIGVNFLAVTAQVAIPILADLEKNGTRVDGYWADDARIDERVSIDQQVEAVRTLEIKADYDWSGLYFGGTAFKKQREVNPEDYKTSAEFASHFMDVVTTSGVATGHSADHQKMGTFREAVGGHALALASGITPENITDYLPWVDAVLVATGINYTDDFYNIDPDKLNLLLQKIASSR